MKTALMSKTWQTKLIHPSAKAPQGYRALSTPVYRGSTTLFSSAATVPDEWDHERAGYTYGLYGTPTSLELAARIGELLSVKVTVPVGVGVPVSLAVMVMAVPEATGLALEVRVNVAGDAVPSSVCVNGAADFGA